MVSAGSARPARQLRRAIVLAAAALVIAGCAPDAGDSGGGSVKGTAGGSAAATSEAADIAAIMAFNERYVGAINDGDAATLASLTTDGHIMLLPGREPIVGKAANDAANAGLFEQFDIDEHWYPEETRVAGDWAFQRGRFTVAATPKTGGAPSTTTGYFLRIYERQPNGEWRMTRDMFNSVSALELD
jgi:ketosteroid isomerase-like protein